MLFFSENTITGNKSAQNFLHSIGTLNDLKLLYNSTLFEIFLKIFNSFSKNIKKDDTSVIYLLISWTQGGGETHVYLSVYQAQNCFLFIIFFLISYGFNNTVTQFIYYNIILFPITSQLLIYNIDTNSIPMLV